MSRRNRIALAGASVLTLIIASPFAAGTLAERDITARLAAAGIDHSGAVHVDALSGQVAVDGLRAGPLHIGKVSWQAGNGGFIGAALAQSASSYKVENLAYEFKNVKISVPSITVDGASVGKDEWIKLFTFDAGLPARLKGLNVTAVSVPSIEVKGEIDPGNKFSYVLRDISANEIASGKAKRIVMGAGSFTSDSSGMKQDGTIKRSEIGGLDMAQIAHVIYSVAKPDEKSLPIYESQTMEGMVSTATGAVAMDMEFGKVTAGAMRMRPLKGKSMADVVQTFLAKAATKTPEQSKKEADLLVAKELLSPLADLMESVEDDGTSGETLKFTVGEKGKPVALVSIGKYSGSYGSPTVPSGFLFSDIAVKSDDVTAKLAQIGVSGFSYVPMLRGMAEVLEQGGEINKADPRKFMPRFGSFTVKGLELDAPDPKSPKGVKPERIKVKLGQFGYAAKNEIKGIPTDLSIGIENLAINLPENPTEDGLKTLKALGYSNVDVSTKVALRWDEAKKEIAIPELSVSGVQMGAVKLSGTLGNIGRELFEADMAMAQVALLGTTAKALSLKIDNTGLAEKLLAMQARQQGRKPDDLRKELGSMAALGIPAILGPSDESKAISGAVSKFLTKPKTIAIDLTAKNAGGIGIPDMATMGDPQAALKLVNVKASASD